jgi:hypothetical protein
MRMPPRPHSTNDSSSNRSTTSSAPQATSMSHRRIRAVAGDLWPRIFNNADTRRLRFRCVNVYARPFWIRVPWRSNIDARPNGLRRLFCQIKRKRWQTWCGYWVISPVHNRGSSRRTRRPNWRRWSILNLLRAFWGLWGRSLLYSHSAFL